ncbi:putative RNA-directed DNA polymerase from transposon BS [Trichonephila clavipes]|nr:putative RNA-directed DNA polymerase from transposon BS [Trichonephila clavipes]
MTGTLPLLLDSVVGGGTPERRCLRVHMDPSWLCPGKGLVLPKTNVDEIATNSRFLLVSLTNDDMSKKSPFAIHKALIGIGGEPKSVKRLRSGNLLIETSSALQTKSVLLAKLFLVYTVTISPYKTLNSSRGVISEPDLLTTPEVKILERFSNQGVIQVRRITIKKDAIIIPTKHLILTFNSPKLPSTIKASYLNSDIRPLTTSNKVAALSTEIQPLVPLPESVSTTSNSEHYNAPEIPQCVKRNSRNKRKRPKVQKAEIEIKMASHRPRKSAPTKLITDDEDMITYDVKEEELEPDPAGKFTIKEDPLNFPKGYLRSLTPSRYRNSRG